MVFRTLRSFGSTQTKQDRPPTRKRTFSSPSPATRALKAQQQGEMEDVEIKSLNKELRILTRIFPDVRPEVFREMLSTFSDESRLHIVAEQLVKHNVQWVNDRRRTSMEETSSGILKEVFEIETAGGKEPEQNDIIPVEESFRSHVYQRAVKAALSQEFKSLSRSTIDGVLAEQNSSYTLSRPILLGLAAKSWRLSFSVLLSKWKRSNNPTNNQHYMLLWPKSSALSPTRVSNALPCLRTTGSTELDRELDGTILQPLIAQRREAHDRISAELASLLNEQEAESADALYECECCFTDTTFEALATCSEGRHQICFRCIQSSVSEALYGQSWILNIDHERGQLACFTPSDTPCTGCIPQFLAQRAILQVRGGDKTWTKLQSRLAEESLRQSGAKVIKCPFCGYAEADDIWLPSGSLRWRLNVHSRPFSSLLFLALGMVVVCLVWWQYLFLSFIMPTRLPPPLTLFTQALNNLIRTTHLSQRFACRNPSCARASCRVCHAAWRDVHKCWESEELGLRKVVESARTAALKRTCPVCGVGFVKESGCNKMVCVCGYSMCYICRQGLGRKPPANTPRAAGDGPELPPPAAAARRPDRGAAAGILRWTGIRNPDDDDDDDNDDRDGRQDRRADQDEDLPAEGEGYRHFCQHFRPTGGRCAQCERCDLYRAEDEDEIVRRAGLRAEKDWRRQQGGKGKGKAEGRERAKNRNGVQMVVDSWVGIVLRC